MRSRSQQLCSSWLHTTWSIPASSPLGAANPHLPSSRLTHPSASAAPTLSPQLRSEFHRRWYLPHGGGDRATGGGAEQRAPSAEGARVGLWRTLAAGSDGRVCTADGNCREEDGQSSMIPSTLSLGSGRGAVMLTCVRRRVAARSPLPLHHRARLRLRPRLAQAASQEAQKGLHSVQSVHLPAPSHLLLPAQRHPLPDRGVPRALRPLPRLALEQPPHTRERVVRLQGDGGD